MKIKALIAGVVLATGAGSASAASVNGELFLSVSQGRKRGGFRV